MVPTGPRPRRLCLLGGFTWRKLAQAAPPRQYALLFLCFTALRAFFKVDDAQACTLGDIKLEVFCESVPKTAEVRFRRFDDNKP
jgi:hypothetical protein